MNQRIFLILRGIAFSLFLFAATNAYAQPSEQPIKIMLAPEKASWTYNAGQPVNFTVAVFKNGNPVNNVMVRYQWGPEKLPAVKNDSIQLKSGAGVIKAGTLKQPGFLRCIVEVQDDGQTYREVATAGFDPEKIKPTIENPSDFRQFWDSAKAELATIPSQARMTILPERCTDKVNVYHVSIQGYMGANVYGILAMPKKEGKYPAILRVPGAGIRPYAGDVSTAAEGFITLEIGIHGVPVNLDMEVYNNLSRGALNGYWTLNMDDRNKFYYKRVYLGCVRANDFLTGLEAYDGKNLGVAGGSQGGALAIITASLDDRVQYLASYYPALCDLTGYLHNRAGGWPHYFNAGTNSDKKAAVPGARNAAGQLKDKLETASYYDVVNFARHLKVPGMYSWGFNDETCPPTSMYAAYNVIKAPTELFLALETGHWTYGEQRFKMEQWLKKNLTSGN